MLSWCGVVPCFFSGLFEFEFGVECGALNEREGRKPLWKERDAEDGGRRQGKEWTAEDAVHGAHLRLARAPREGSIRQTRGYESWFVWLGVLRE